MDLHTQVKLHKEISKKIEELELQKKELGLAIMQQMTDRVMNLAGFVIRRYSRLSVKLTIEQARALNAIKIEEAVDTEKVKALYKSGQPIRGVSEIHYIQITTSVNNKAVI